MTSATVPVLYLDPGFLAFLADRALRILKKSNDFERSHGPNPTLSAKSSL
jgi:hypothetical protein